MLVITPKISRHDDHFDQYDKIWRKKCLKCLEETNQIDVLVQVQVEERNKLNSSRMNSEFLPRFPRISGPTYKLTVKCEQSSRCDSDGNSANHLENFVMLVALKSNEDFSARDGVVDAKVVCE